MEMGTQPDPACPVAFGPFEFDEVSAQLRKHGHVLRLPGQSLQILLVLVRQPGRSSAGMSCGSSCGALQRLAILNRV